MILIGLDGATFDVVRPLCERGRLPTFSRLIQNGASGDLQSTIPPITPPAFASLLTGCNPGKHGVFDFYTRQVGNYNPQPANGSTICNEALQENLSRHGRAVGMVNVPMTYPPRPVNGFMVTGMMTPPGAPYTYPQELQATLDEMEYRIELDSWYRRGHEQETMAGILAVLRVQTKAVLRLMKERPTDLLAVVFRATDLAQHYFWRFMDREHPGYSQEEGRRHGDLIARCYEACDSALSEIMDAAGPGSTVFVVSDHGFGRETKMVRLSNWLHRLGFLHFNDSPLGRLKKLSFDLGLTADNVINTLDRLSLEKLFTRVSRETKSRMFSSFFLSYADVDWARTRAYARGRIGQIFLNVRGRQPLGIVEPGDEYHILRSEIAQRLHEMKDPDSGECMVDRVYVKEEIYTGRHAEEAPDILIDWRDMEYWAFDMLAGGRKVIAPNPLTRSGGHRMNGVFLAHGPDIAVGQRLEEPRIIDVAPTLLHLMGLPVPESMDGCVLRSVFADGSSSVQRPVIYEHLNGSTPKETTGYSLEEEQQVRERLRQRAISHDR